MTPEQGSENNLDHSEDEDSANADIESSAEEPAQESPREPAQELARETTMHEHQSQSAHSHHQAASPKNAKRHAHAPESAGSHASAHETHHAAPAKDAKESDEELSLDFSFAKSWFGKKKAASKDGGEEHHDHHEHPEHHDHQSNHEHQEHHDHADHHGARHDAKSGEKAGDEELSLDFSFFKKLTGAKIAPIILTILLLLIPLTLTIVIRSMPSSLPLTDDWARNSVYSYYKNQISSQVSSQYPNLPDSNKQSLVDSEFAKFQSANQAQLDTQVQATSNQLKDIFRYEENGHQVTYLGDLDSYFWLRYARNIITKGMTCDAIIDGRCADTYMVAPTNRADADNNLHIYAIAYVYNFIRIFDPQYTLMEASFKVPLILGLLAAVFAFFIGRRIAGNIGGLFMSVLVSVSPVILSRSLGSDNDIWEIALPLLAFWLFLEAFETKDWRFAVLFSCLSGIVIAIFSLVWDGWWYVFDFMFVTLIGYIIFVFIHQWRRKSIGKTLFGEIKQPLIIAGCVFVVAGVLITAMAGTANAFFGVGILGPLIFTNIKIASFQNLWPNVYTTVAELNSAGIDTIIGQTGGPLLFFLAFMGIVTTLVHRKPSTREWIFMGVSALVYLYLVSSIAYGLPLLLYLVVLAAPLGAGLLMILFLGDGESATEKRDLNSIKVAILLTIWFLGTIYAASKGVRFILLITPAFAMGVACAVGFIYRLISDWAAKDFNVKPWIAKTIIFIALCWLLVAPVQAGYQTARSFVPSINDAWWDSLTYIKDHSSKDAIINSWWDFGHWFKYVADRRVTLDGASQNDPVAHWLGLMLQTPDPKRSVAILRMLDCGSNMAFDEVDKLQNSTEISENIVSAIIMESKEGARKDLLLRGYSGAQADKILSYTHCDPPEDYLITSDDMIGKAGVWAHFGLWDFDKAFAAVNARGKPQSEGVAILKKEFNYTDAQALARYNEVESLTDDPSVNNYIAPWPNYVTGGLTPCTNTTRVVTCPIGVGIGGSGNQNAVIDSAIINLSDKKSAKLVVGFYDATSHTRLGENIIGPSGVVTTGPGGLTRTAVDNSSFNFDVLITQNADGSYAAMMADPLLSQSIFTQLYYLDGKFTPQFEKFVEKTSPVGTRVVIWKVHWPSADEAAGASASPPSPTPKMVNATATIIPAPLSKNNSLSLTII